MLLSVIYEIMFFSLFKEIFGIKYKIRLPDNFNIRYPKLLDIWSNPDIDILYLFIML